jgi:MtN3 and saliva related transmembrane protein
VARRRSLVKPTAFRHGESVNFDGLFSGNIAHFACGERPVALALIGDRLARFVRFNNNCSTGRASARRRLGWRKQGGVSMSKDRSYCFYLLMLNLIALCGCESLGIHDTQSLLSPSLHRSEVVGFVAGFGTTFAALPDLVTMFRRRSSAGMNPRMAGIMCVFQVAWIYYGLLIASRPVILWNVIAVVTNAVSVAAYFRFAAREKGRPGQHESE